MTIVSKDGFLTGMTQCPRRAHCHGGSHSCTGQDRRAHERRHDEGMLINYVGA